MRRNPRGFPNSAPTRSHVFSDISAQSVDASRWSWETGQIKHAGRYGRDIRQYERAWLMPFAMKPPAQVALVKLSLDVAPGLLVDFDQGDDRKRIGRPACTSLKAFLRAGREADLDRPHTVRTTHEIYHAHAAASSSGATNWRHSRSFPRTDAALIIFGQYRDGMFPRLRH